jgi:hypothetical protein
MSFFPWEMPDHASSVIAGNKREAFVPGSEATMQSSFLV